MRQRMRMVQRQKRFARKKKNVRFFFSFFTLYNATTNEEQMERKFKTHVPCADHWMFIVCPDDP